MINNMDTIVQNYEQPSQGYGLGVKDLSGYTGGSGAMANNLYGAHSRGINVPFGNYAKSDVIRATNPMIGGYMEEMRANEDPYLVTHDNLRANQGAPATHQGGVRLLNAPYGPSSVLENRAKIVDAASGLYPDPGSYNQSSFAPKIPALNDMNASQTGYRYIRM